MPVHESKAFVYYNPEMFISQTLLSYDYESSNVVLRSLILGHI